MTKTSATSIHIIHASDAGSVDEDGDGDAAARRANDRRHDK